MNQDFASHDPAARERLRAAASAFADERRQLLAEQRGHRRDALVDQAVGVIMARSACGSAEAVAQLAAVAQRSQRPLADVAADVVAEASGRAVERPDRSDTLRLRPEIAGLDRSADGDGLARGLAAEALGFSHPTGVAIGLLDDDGAVTIVGAHGFSARGIRRWRRVPPAVDSLINRALRSGRPVWTDATAQDPPPPLGEPAGADRFQTRVAVPVRLGRAVLGAVELAWPAEAALDARAQREVEAVVRSVGPSLLRTLGPEVSAGAGSPGGVNGADAPADSAGAEGDSAWQDLLDLLDQPAFTLRGDPTEPVAVGRFQVIARNQQATELMTPLPTDGSMAATVPWLTAADLPDRLAAVVRTGAAARLAVQTGALGVDSLTAIRVGLGTVVVVCHRVDVEASAAEGLLERLARFGTWRWDVDGDRVAWSAEALRIVDAPGLGDSAGIDRPPYTVHPDDLDAERRFVKTLTVERRPAEAEFRILHYGGEPTRVRVAAEPLEGPAEGDGAAASPTAPAPGSVVGVVQDVTEWRRAETGLEVARVQLAAQRSRADAERQLASALQQAVVPSAARNQPLRSGVQIAARYRPASASAGVGGDWYSVFPLRDDKLLLAIGDVAGHGLPAASAMADLHHGLRGMALAETRPGRLLTLLNELVEGMPQFTIASACVLLWDPATRHLTWGNAGHPAPLRTRGGVSVPLDDRFGPMLGADPRAVYEDSEADVASGDVLLLYTDGLVERRRVGDDETTAHLLEQTRNPDADLDRYADRLLEGARSDTDDDVCVLAVRFE
ncbi:SpoIIE family protein phosphatase [Catenulispora sp. NF23]|uniref:SpoIIE family protein phosphatase n=1 Tax=Catenulispora pinistramenti TaxID=2705254 RepID=A0ABS5L6Y1_9ACTN|nr:SpoIIE family protein phosphatase [Catenulispora pinistramenti]MBS2538792.1 SpoIIE family protein phosphatase [Catenulispora pinistramenti]MBS2553904.1 SpoIIE family protein phosphatase [Catenulispora pinistramenti]